MTDPAASPAPPADDSPASPERAPERAPLDIPEPGLPTAKIDVLYRVFCARPQMPSLDDLLKRLISRNPYNPEGGFVFAPPTGMRRLQEALGASKDYFLMGYLREEAPQLWTEAEAVLADEGRTLDEPERVTVRQSPLCVVIRAEIDNPENNEFVETLAHLADTFRDLCHGVVWDVYMRRMWSEPEWADAMRAPLSPLSHVRVLEDRSKTAESGALTLRTSGLVKFGSPDLELCAVPADAADEVADFLLDASEHLMQGDLLDVDDVVTYRTTQVRVVEGAPAGGGTLGTYRLVDAPADPDTPFADTDGSEGAPRLLAAVAMARVEVEGQRARGGRAAS